MGKNELFEMIMYDFMEEALKKKKKKSKKFLEN